ncbi:L-threonylcarbamoyladenylate synthase [Sporosarcina contaminans]|uniref:Threonylcarbamoyl-AMP synthase n=1 Tax=Sporosarcina contaminans TaxID=633403 RepID=A0ABW3TWE0_9BACL
METKIVSVDSEVDNVRNYQQAVDILKSGEVVAFPTETVYGLGALATKREAVQKIYDAKGRPSDNPLIIHIGKKEDANLYAVDIPEAAQKLMDRFWPGPLTMVFHKRPGVIAENATPGFETVGIRMPDHPVALQLLNMLDGPLAAPSANRSGKPSPTEAEHVYADLNGRIPMIVDGGQTGVGVESTVLDMTTEPPAILRPGGLTKEMIEKVIGPVQSEGKTEKDKAPRAPGMKYMHYAPNAPLFMIEASETAIQTAVQNLHKEGKRIAVIGPEEFSIEEADWYFSVGSLHDYDAIAANLYRAIRQCDETEADVILAAETEASGVGEAIMNRLTKAANGKRYSQR